MNTLNTLLSLNLPTGKKTKLIAWWLFNKTTRDYISQLVQRFQQAGLMPLLNTHPFLFYMFRSHTFLRKANGEPQAILDLLSQHYVRLSQSFPLQQIEIFFNAAGQSLWQTEIDEQLSVRVAIEYDHRMRFEGQLSFKLYINEEESFLINFVFNEHNGVYVGGIQGVKEKLEVYRYFTKKMHGLRPQNFIWMAFLDWCQALGITQVQGIRPEWHAYQNEMKSQDKVSFDYCSFWQEVGGEIEDSYWYRLPIDYPHKPIEEVEQKRRSLYRKRYALLTDMKTALQAQAIAHSAQEVQQHAE